MRICHKQHVCRQTCSCQKLTTGSLLGEASPYRQLQRNELPERQWAQASAEVHWAQNEVPCITCAAHADPKISFAGVVERSSEHGRLVAVQEPPLDLLRGLAACAGSHMSHQTRQGLLQAYHLTPHEQQQCELLRGGSLPTGASKAEVSRARQGSCSPADSGNALCLAEISPHSIVM